MDAVRPVHKLSICHYFLTEVLCISSSVTATKHKPCSPRAVNPGEATPRDVCLLHQPTKPRAKSGVPGLRCV